MVSCSKCDQVVRARGFCGKHYRQWRLAAGDHEVKFQVPTEWDEKERFKHFGYTVHDSGCWVWNDRVDDCGYGTFKYMGKKALAHRVSWSIANGTIPEGMVVRHSCDNPPCVNPAHLLIGTQLDNIEDMRQRGRGRGGSGSLDEEKVRRVRALVGLGKPMAWVEREMGLSSGQVSRVMSKKIWAWVD